MKRSLYRLYRPQTFEELVGQDHVARTLRNAVEGSAVAHAYVFAGPRGTGKTSTARILAKALNCVGVEGEPRETPTAAPCGRCRHCTAIADGVSLDVVEMDAASNRSIDDIRELRDKIAFAPVDGRFKVYIIDEVHMLTREAFNALLKTLEEPPANVVFVLATTEPHKIPETIISRCQRFDFRRPHVRDIAHLLATIVERENTQLKEEPGGTEIAISQAALAEIARHSQGGFRDAIGTLEKLITYADGTISPSDVLDALGVTTIDLLFEVVDIVAERQTAEALQFVQRLANDGIDPSPFIRDLLRHLRQLFLLQHLEDSARDDATLRALAHTVELDDQLLLRLLPQANNLPPHEIIFLIELLGDAQRQIRDGLDPRLQLELALVKATQPHLDHSAAALEERLRRLENALAGEETLRLAERTHAGRAGEERASAARPAPQPPTHATPVQAEQPTAEAKPEYRPSAVTLDRVKRAWELVLQRVQPMSGSLAALLGDARPKALNGERLTIAVPSNLVLTRASQPGNIEFLSDALAATLESPLTPVFELAAKPAPEQPSTPQAPPTAIDFTDLINQAKDTFNAEVLPDDS